MKQLAWRRLWPCLAAGLPSAGCFALGSARAAEPDCPGLSIEAAEAAQSTPRADGRYDHAARIANSMTRPLRFQVNFRAQDVTPLRIAHVALAAGDSLTITIGLGMQRLTMVEIIAALNLPCR